MFDILRRTNRATRRRNDRGATAVEYSILAALIAAIIVATVVLVGQDALTNWTFSW